MTNYTLPDLTTFVACGTNRNRNSSISFSLTGDSKTTAYFDALASLSYTKLTSTNVNSKLNIGTHVTKLTASPYPQGGLASGTTATSFPEEPSQNTSTADRELYNDKVTIYCTELMDEFCFRYRVFKHALDTLLTNIILTDSSRPTDIAITSMKTTTATLNTRCMNVLKIMSNVANTLDTRTGNFQSQIANINTVLKDNVSDIQKYNSILSSADIESEVTKSMTEYTYEKNKYNSNLLALYGGLNIVALAMLVYIYRS